MRSSRIAQETAKVVSTLSHADYIPQRQTRSFAASLQAFTANGNVSQELGRTEVKQNDSDDDSSLSSVRSSVNSDIEDVLGSFQVSTSRKRKQEFDSPATTVTTISSNTARTSPRKAHIKAENGNDDNQKKERRKPARRVTIDAGEVTIHPPSNWEEIYDAVKEMRKNVLAPVDTMGCETLAEEHLSPRDKRFQTLIALMLSSQTKDTTNAIAMRRLQTDLPSPGLTLENVLAVDPVHLNEMIYVVGFHNNKTRYIKAAAEILRDKFDSDIPSTIEGLMSLPGVGPKMAYLCLSAAWGRTEGIGVDVHVHRITNLWGWHKTKGPEETRMWLEGWLPRDKWHEINHLLVGFGQTICLPVGRKCGECTLAEKKLCPARVVGKKTEVKRMKKEIKEKGMKIVQEAVAVKVENATANDLQRA